MKLYVTSISVVLFNLILIGKVVAQFQSNVSEQIVHTDMNKQKGYGGNSTRGQGLYLYDAGDSDWPMGVIPYYFNISEYDYIVSRNVRLAMNKIEGVSCVKFKPLLLKPSDNITWIHFTNPNKQRECSHGVKRQNHGEIPLVLGYDCLKSRDILHTLLHGIGFNDEVTHRQRDRYIRILWENIHPAYRHLYRVEREVIKSVLVEYDPMSIMHFHDRAFTMNGHATVASLVPGLQINPSGDLSHLDKMKLRLLFGHECNKRNVGDMLDTCKIVLHKNKNKEIKDVDNNSNDDSAAKENSDEDKSTADNDNVSSENKIQKEKDNVTVENVTTENETLENKQKQKQKDNATLENVTEENVTSEKQEKQKKKDSATLKNVSAENSENVTSEKKKKQKDNNDVTSENITTENVTSEKKQKGKDSVTLEEMDENNVKMQFIDDRSESSRATDGKRK